MRWICVCVGLALAVACTDIVHATPIADFYVSPAGSDQWSGTLAEPNQSKTDGPFATLGRAKDVVRHHQKGADSGEVLVLLRGGLYHLDETVVFGVEDSGEGKSRITYAAYPEETPVFSSGIKISNWQRPSSPIDGVPANALKHLWVSDLSEYSEVPFRFYTLYDSVGLLPRARSEGFIPLASSDASPVRSSKIKKDRQTSLFRFPPGRVKDWPNLEDVEVVVRPYHAWIVNILPLLNVDEKAGLAQTSIRATYIIDEMKYLPGTDSVWVENVLEALDQPGEWVLNTKKRQLYLWSRNGERPADIVVPALREFIRVEGRIDEMGPSDVPVRNLTFKGLTFMHGERDVLLKDDKGLQHDWQMHDKANSLIRFRGAEDCVIDRCHILHSGGTGIRADLYSQNIRITNNHIEHIGGTGILLCGYGPGTKDVNSNNLVYNNRIHHVGEVYSHSPGIFVWQSGENRVANNLIHNTPYSGIIVSGVMTDMFDRGSGKRELGGITRWHEVGGKPRKMTLDQVRPFLHTRNNLIENNEIHHVMELLGDGNGIYIRGAGPGNIIRRNYIHHLLSPITMQSAIRTDGGQTDTLIAENIIYKCVSHGMHLKLNNRAENNIIACLIDSEHQGKTILPSYFKLREGPLTGGAIQRNIMYHDGERAKFYDQGNNPRLESAWAREADTDNNIFYSAGNPKLSRNVLRASQKHGVDKNSLAADPLFADVENGDFSLPKNSPAHDIGFIPIDLSEIGLRDGR